jgi:transcriptional regulator with XRE-family HTH domain
MADRTGKTLLHAIRTSKKLAGKTQGEIAQATGIHQSQISRIMNGDFKRVGSRNLTRLCRYANVQLSQHRVPSLLLNNTVQRVWDGSPNHEKALVTLLKAAEMLALAHAAQPDAHIVGKRRRQ